MLKISILDTSLQITNLRLQLHLPGANEVTHWPLRDVVVILNEYRQVSNISRTLVGDKIVDHSDVVGASPVGAAPTTSSFSTLHLASLD